MESQPPPPAIDFPALDDVAPYEEPLAAPNAAWMLPLVLCMATTLLVAAYVRFVRTAGSPDSIASAPLSVEPAAQAAPAPAPVVARVATAPESETAAPAIELLYAPTRPEPTDPVKPIDVPEPKPAQPTLTHARSDPLKLFTSGPERQLSAAAREDEDEDDLQRAAPVQKRAAPHARDPGAPDALVAALKRDAPKKKKSNPDDPDPLEGPGDPDEKPQAMPPLKSDPVLEVSAKPKPLCTRCMGSGFIPSKPPRPYVNLQGGGAPDPNLSVPWSCCPLCQKSGDPKKLIEVEKERIAAALKSSDEWGAASGLKFLRAETHHITILSEMSANKTRDVANALETVAAHLQNATQRTLLTNTRPDTHTMLITWGRPNYLKLIDALEKSGKFPGEDFALSRKAGGSTIKNLAFYNGHAGVPAENVAIFQFAGMQMDAATESRAPAWLAEGFRAYCENTATGRNLVYSFEYELNEVQLGANWNVDIRTFAQQGKLKTWDKVFGVDLIKMKPIDYLTCYSMVAYLLKSSPDNFCRLLIEFRQGTPSDKALEKIYGRRITDLQMQWAQWALQQR